VRGFFSFAAQLHSIFVNFVFVIVERSLNEVVMVAIFFGL